jgi:hypothetical protein
MSADAIVGLWLVGWLSASAVFHCVLARPAPLRAEEERPSSIPRHRRELP